MLDLGAGLWFAAAGSARGETPARMKPSLKGAGLVPDTEQPALTWFQYQVLKIVADLGDDAVLREIVVAIEQRLPRPYRLAHIMVTLERLAYGGNLYRGKRTSGRTSHSNHTATLALRLTEEGHARLKTAAALYERGTT